MSKSQHSSTQRLSPIERNVLNRHGGEYQCQLLNVPDADKTTTFILLVPLRSALHDIVVHSTKRSQTPSSDTYAGKHASRRR